MKTVEGVARALTAEGVRLVSNVPDEVTVLLSQTMSDVGIRVARPRHEQNAVLMADGYARATGDVGVCVIGHGPAIAQTGTALVTAQKKGSPVLVLIGQDSSTNRGSAKTFDERRFVECAGARFMSVRSPGTLYEDLQEAFRLVRLRRGPVVLAIPDRATLLSDLRTDDDYVPAQKITPAVTDPMRDSEGIEEATAMLAHSRHPLIFAGRGAVESGARGEIVALADRLGALLATSLQAWGFFGDHPRNVGLLGTYSTEAVSSLLVEADCILALGVSLNQYQTGGGRLGSNARIIQVDADEGRIGAWTRVDLGIVGDVGVTVQAIDRTLQSLGADGRSAWTAERFQGLLAASREKPPAAAPSPTVPLPTSRLLASLDDMLPRERFVVVDGGYFLNFLVDQIRLTDPMSWLWSLDFASIGLGLGFAIGAALGRADRRCVLFAGDGGFSMNLQELDTLARENVPLTVVIINNSAYESETNFLRAHGMSTAMSVFPERDFCGVARAFGIEAERVNDMEGLASIAHRVSAAEGPFLIDASVVSDEHRARSRYV